HVWLLTGGIGVLHGLSALGLASDVLYRRLAGDARTIHTQQGQRIGGVAPEPHRLGNLWPGDRPELATVPVHGAAHDVHEFHVARDPGHVPHLPDPAKTFPAAYGGRDHHDCHPGQSVGGAERRALLRANGAAAHHDDTGRVGPIADPALDPDAHRPHNHAGSFPDGFYGVRCLGRHTRSDQRTVTPAIARVPARLCLPDGGAVRFQHFLYRSARRRTLHVLAVHGLLDGGGADSAASGNQVWPGSE